MIGRTLLARGTKHALTRVRTEGRHQAADPRAHAFCSLRRARATTRIAVYGPYARWCGRGRWVTAAPMPINVSDHLVAQRVFGIACGYPDANARTASPNRRALLLCLDTERVHR